MLKIWMDAAKNSHNFGAQVIATGTIPLFMPPDGGCPTSARLPELSSDEELGSRANVGKFRDFSSRSHVPTFGRSRLV